jgi:hypothetical protein
MNDGGLMSYLEPPITDGQLRMRTEELLKAAENLSLQLQLQTERLAAAIDQFDKDIITPLRDEVVGGERDRSYE